MIKIYKREMSVFFCLFVKTSISKKLIFHITVKKKDLEICAVALKTKSSILII